MQFGRYLSDPGRVQRRVEFANITVPSQTILVELRVRGIDEEIDTTSPGGKLVFHIFGALAEFERNLIRERTNAGLAPLRARGRKGGRPKSLDEDRRKLAVQLYNDGKHSVMDVCCM